MKSGHFLQPTARATGQSVILGSFSSFSTRLYPSRSRAALPEHVEGALRDHALRVREGCAQEPRGFEHARSQWRVRRSSLAYTVVLGERRLHGKLKKQPSPNVARVTLAQPGRWALRAESELSGSPGRAAVFRPRCGRRRRSHARRRGSGPEGGADRAQAGKLTARPSDITTPVDVGRRIVPGGPGRAAGEPAIALVQRCRT